jgi:hypothetical protein
MTKSGRTNRSQYQDQTHLLEQSLDQSGTSRNQSHHSELFQKDGCFNGKTEGRKSRDTAPLSKMETLKNHTS